MKFIYVRTYERLSSCAFEIVKTHIIKGSRVFGFPTGSTPIGLYGKMADAYRNKELLFSRIHGVNLDEYVGISPEHPSSYHTYMQEHLYQPIQLPKNQIFIPNGMNDDLEKECQNLETFIMENNGIDLTLLGVGGNGHIGFNEPGTPFGTKTHVVELDDSTRLANAKHFTDGNVPTHAITMGLQTIMSSKEIVLLVYGNKKDVFERLLDGKVDESLPCSILHRHPNVTVIVELDSIT